MTVREFKDALDESYREGYRDGEESRLADLMIAADHAEEQAFLGAPESVWVSADGSFAAHDEMSAGYTSALGGVQYIRADLFDKLLEERDELVERVKELEAQTALTGRPLTPEEIAIARNEPTPEGYRCGKCDGGPFPEHALRCPKRTNERA